MIYRKPWLWIAATMLVLSACSDDAGKDKGGSNEKAGEGESCAQTADCKDNLICDNGICKAEESECDSDEACGKGMKCVEGACKPDTSKCESDEACGEDMKCIEGTCQPKDAQTCDSDEGCASGMKCDEGVCKTIVNAGDSCNASEYCEDSVCEDGVCRVYAKAGESCDNQTYLCQTGLICSEYGTCYAPLEQGEECDDIDKICNSDFFCSPERLICLKQANYGEDCGDGSYAECDMDANLQCYDGKCRHLSQDKKCDESTVCPEKQICFENACIDKIGCENDDACGADTYCCKDDACQTKNVCVAYGTGPRGNTNAECRYETVPGLFEADIQCEWLKPQESDPYPNHYNLVVLPVVAKTPHEKLGTSNAILALTYWIGNPGVDGLNYDDPYDWSVVRIINGETCELLETVGDEGHYFNGGVPLTVGDVDDDGYLEIFGHQARIGKSDNDRRGYVAYHWNKDKNKYEFWWESDQISYGYGNQAPLSLHDINDDGIPELIAKGGEVYNSRTGKRLTSKTLSSGVFPTAGDVDNDGKVEFIGTGSEATIYVWNNETNEWTPKYTKLPQTYNFIAYGDFGTPSDSPEKFDWEHFDGIAEIVSASGGVQTGKATNSSGKEVSYTKSIYGYVEIHTLSGQQIFKKGGYYFKDGAYDSATDKHTGTYDTKNGFYGGGAPTIGDFDGDGFPEVAIAYGDEYTVFDPRCTKGIGTCEDAENGILWTRTSQDVSSYVTGSSLFDFDGDGSNEVVYADECFTRVYDGKTGDVLFSARHNSRTWYEMPIIVDVDNDQSAEIVMGANQTMSCPTLDPVHRGLRCVKNEDCTSKICEDGLCRCTEESQCNWRKNGEGVLIEEYACTEPLPSDKEKNAKNVCRAKRKNADRTTGIRVMRDRYDRWASSRNIWNQQVYSITNIDDTQTIPKTSKWTPNYMVSGLNNFRANSQGTVGMNAAPDITGKLDKDNLCVISGVDNTITLTGLVCNRGTKTVGSKMPASFYQVDDDDNIIKKYCTSYTSENVPVGGCLEVSCSLSGDQLTDVTILMKVNDDGEGGRTTVECNDKNNTDKVTITSCQVN